ncbi:4'-phosphopantetheinyl transferase family protein [Paracoccus spongiarum]|uniref:Enterobactin synthase component D n=1 Tax=Paracoccus spongiarum TaxID=3064387 RepID=A0ABT9J862_9RHOB|nr:4'-phosphopantetheinyl transferase superfamily protein [Paracoccus sp. 2205BS29-5]MDP5305995.1 4'-phosphopantetheinyl transferase superfamily protein [Paracoccus sp. 2205BS29-5]
MIGLARILAGLFPDGVGHGVVPIGAGGELWPGEAEAVAGAVDHRRAEFAAGRHAARCAMAAAGLSGAAIPAAPDRAPVWPEGVVGSITHAEDVALAVAAPDTLVAGLGLDVEPDAPLPRDVLSEICDGGECAWLAGQTEPLRWARLIFCAKEAAFKCQYPASCALFGFDAMSVRVDPAAGALEAVFNRAYAPFPAGARLQGRFARTGGLVVAGFLRQVG